MSAERIMETYDNFEDAYDDWICTGGGILHAGEVYIVGTTEVIEMMADTSANTATMNALKDGGRDIETIKTDMDNWNC